MSYSWPYLLKKKCLTLDKFNLLLARKKIKQCIHGTVRTSIAELVYTLIVDLCIQLCIHQSDYFRWKTSINAKSINKQTDLYIVSYIK